VQFVERRPSAVVLHKWLHQPSEYGFFYSVPICLFSARLPVNRWQRFPRLLRRLPVMRTIQVRCRIHNPASTFQSLAKVVSSASNGGTQSETVRPQFSKTAYRCLATAVLRFQGGKNLNYSVTVTHFDDIKLLYRAVVFAFTTSSFQPVREALSSAFVANRLNSFCYFVQLLNLHSALTLLIVSFPPWYERITSTHEQRCCSES